MTTEQQPKEEGRNEKGRFTKGNKGGPGRPKKVKVKEDSLEFHATLKENGTDEKASKVIDDYLSLEIKDDIKALNAQAKFALDYFKYRFADSNTLMKQQEIDTLIGGLELSEEGTQDILKTLFS